jgi:excisionase family DNA binding protein
VSDDQVSLALRSAIAAAKARGQEEISGDDLLLGCLFAISRFGVVRLGNWTIDLEPFGLNWMIEPPQHAPKAAYSQAVVEILDQATVLARMEGSKIGVEHILVCFSHVPGGLMGALRQRYGIDAASWRAAVGLRAEPAREARPASPRDYLSPEEAAEFLGVHVQTLRGYIRTKKLPALRVAGERVIRIHRSNLEKLLESM